MGMARGMRAHSSAFPKVFYFSKSLAFSLATLTGSGFWPTSAIQVFSQETPAEKTVSEAREAESLLSPSSYGNLPALWHLKITGADWAKHDLELHGFNKARVVVLDHTVQRGPARILPRPERSVRRKKMRLLGSVRGVDVVVESGTGLLLNRLKALWGGAPLKEVEVIDPREKDIPAHHPHGDHVAGTIGGGNPLYGVSPAAQIDSLSLFETPIYTMQEDIPATLENFAQTNLDAFIMNISLGFRPQERVISALNAISEQPGASLVMAAGNDGIPAGPWTTAFHVKKAIVVGAFAPTGDKAYFSNFGSRLDFVAPGVGILSRGEALQLDGEKLEFMEGTSMAAPMVSGALANLRAIRPQINVEQMKTILAKSAWDLGQPGKDGRTGHGLVNILKATQAVMRMNQLASSDESLFDSMIQDSQNYDLQMLSRGAQIERSESCLACPSRMDLLYRAVLLHKNPEMMSVLALQHEEAPLWSFGLQFMAFNRPQNSLTDADAEAFSETIYRVQSLLLKIREQDWGIFESLANADLILKLASRFKDRSDLETLFSARMRLVAPERVEEVKQAMKAESKTPPTLVAMPSEPIEKEPALGPVPATPSDEQLPFLLPSKLLSKI
jgi:hypothetical protein